MCVLFKNKNINLIALIPIIHNDLSTPNTKVDERRGAKIAELCPIPKRKAEVEGVRHDRWKKSEAVL